MSDALLEAFTTGRAERVKERKSQEVVDFLRANWKLFIATRSAMSMLCEELEQRGELNPDTLGDALGLPRNVYFRRTKMLEAGKFWMRPQSSAVMKSMYKLLEKNLTPKGRQNDVYLFLASGARSLLLSNAEPMGGDGIIMAITENDNTIYAMPAEDASKRYPGMFGRNE